MNGRVRTWDCPVFLDFETLMNLETGPDGRQKEKTP